MPSTKPAKILVVDDDTDCRWLITHALEDAGFVPVPVSCPEDALSRALEEDVEAAFLDIEMPGLSGLDVLEMLRADPWLADLLVIMVSARADEQDRVEGLRRGADDFVGKPFCPEELILRLQRHLSRGLRRRRSPTAPLLRKALAAGTLDAETVAIGRYVAHEVIGRGASGLVLRATDPRLHRKVAIKLLGRARRDSNTAADLDQEATALAGIDHPNIVQVFDAGHVEELAFLVMELVDGESLDHRLRRGPLTIAETVQLGIAVCDALAAAHDAGWIHRDLKPANILLAEDGTIKLTDF
ncbi:MAG: response regulator, partial [Acidobacteriota bacterium]